MKIPYRIKPNSSVPKKNTKNKNLKSIIFISIDLRYPNLSKKAEKKCQIARS